MAGPARSGTERMRLICPNCDAQYEVDDDAIPDGGRDVQCSNCGHAWFQLRPEVEAANWQQKRICSTRREAVRRSRPAAACRQPPPLPTGPSAARTADPEPTACSRVEAATGSAPARSPAPRRRRTLDDSRAGGAARRGRPRGRRAPGRSAREPTMRDPARSGVGRPPAVAAPAARRAAALIAPDPEEPSRRDPAKPATRRDLLPDIEEINSTLRASDDRARRRRPKMTCRSAGPTARAASAAASC